jgi:hypothetical protein
MDALTKTIAAAERDVADRKSRNRDITDSAYSVLSKHYFELFTLTGDETKFEAAINNITYAIEKNPKVEHYATRAKYYMDAGKRDLAKDDIEYIRNNIPSGIAGIYVKNIIQKYDITEVATDILDKSSSGGKRKKKRIMRTKRKRNKRTRHTKRR